MISRNDAYGLATRTKKNLAYLEAAFQDGEDVHLVTQVVNSVLGLVVVPWEREKPNYLERLPLSQLDSSKWPAWDFTLGSTDSLEQLVRRLRNGFAHGHFRFSSDSRSLDEVLVTVEDIRRGASEPYWSAQISALGLRDFCYAFCDLIEGLTG